MPRSFKNQAVQLFFSASTRSQPPTQLPSIVYGNMQQYPTIFVCKSSISFSQTFVIQGPSLASLTFPCLHLPALPSMHFSLLLQSHHIKASLLQAHFVPHDSMLFLMLFSLLQVPILHICCSAFLLKVCLFYNFSPFFYYRIYPSASEMCV